MVQSPQEMLEVQQKRPVDIRVELQCRRLIILISTRLYYKEDKTYDRENMAWQNTCRSL